MMGTFSQPVVPITANGTGSGGFGGNGDALWIFALLVLFGGGGFGGAGRGASSEVSGFQLGELSGKVATQTSMNQGFAGLSSQNASETAQIQNSMNQGFTGLNTVVQNGFQQTFIGLSDRINAVASAVASCCCELKQQMAEGFGQVRYDLANFTAQTNERILLGNQKVLDALAADKAERQAEKIRSLELNAAMCNVVRYPNQQTFTAGPYPIPAGNGCY